MRTDYFNRKFFAKEGSEGSMDTTVADGNTQEEMKDLGDLLNYDFTKDIPETPAGEEITPSAEGTESNGLPADGTKDGQPADATKTPEGQSDPIEVLKQQNLDAAPKASTSDELISKAMDIMAKQAESTAEGAKEPDAAPPPDDYGYNMTIPDDIIAAVRSEDPQEASQGVHALVTGLAITVHKRVREEFETKMTEMMQQIPNMMQSHTTEASERQRVFDDFYGTYPELNSPQMLGMVKQAATELAKETGAVTYSPEFKAALKAKIDANLSAMVKAAGGTMPEAPVNPGITPPAVPTNPAGNTMMGGNNSRAGEIAGNTIADEINSMAFL